MTVKQLLRSVDSAELTEWQAFYTVEPFGDSEADLRSAVNATTVANTLIKLFARKGAKLIDVKDLVFDRFAFQDASLATTRQDPETLKALLIGALQPTTAKRKRPKRTWGKRRRPGEKR